MQYANFILNEKLQMLKKALTDIVVQKHSGKLRPLPPPIKDGNWANLSPINQPEVDQ